jgi:hypothetical protein
MSFKPLPVYSHGHFGFHSTYGHELKNGGVPNNIKNYNDLANRTAGGHGYFKPSFCHWPTGGYTRKETQHNHRQGEYDVGPQSFEHSQFYTANDVGTAKRERQSDLAVMGSKTSQLTEAALQDWLMSTTTGKRHHATRPDLNVKRDRPQTAPSERSAKTVSTLGLATFSLTKGTAFEPKPKPAPGSTPWFARYPPRPQSAGPAIQRAKEQQALGESLQLWEREVQRQNDVISSAQAPFLGSRGQPTERLAERLREAKAMNAPALGGSSRARPRPASANPTTGPRTRLM